MQIFVEKIYNIQVARYGVGADNISLYTPPLVTIQLQSEAHGQPSAVAVRKIVSFMMVDCRPGRCLLQWLNDGSNGDKSFVLCINWFNIRFMNKRFDPILNMGDVC